MKRIIAIRKIWRWFLGRITNPIVSRRRRYEDEREDNVSEELGLEDEYKFADYD